MNIGRSAGAQPIVSAWRRHTMPDHAPMQAALLAECLTGKTLVDTSPTTTAGLIALEAHLRDRRRHLTMLHIRQPLPGNMVLVGGPGSVDWLVAQHAARLAAG